MNYLNQKYSTVIVGGGIIGCAIAYELSRHGHKNIAVIEKNSTIPGLNQSSTNGGVIHSGIYYPKDIEPLKAKLCVLGNKLMYEFCKKYELPHKRTGKLILARNSQEEENLDFFFQIGIENGVEIKKISAKLAARMEPNIGTVTSALLVPSTGSAALSPLIEKLKELAKTDGVKFFLGTRVNAIHAEKTKFIITLHTNSGIKSMKSDSVINAAGLYSDEIAKMINPSNNYQIDPVRGELYKYNPTSRKDISFKGMHLYSIPFCYYSGTKQIAELPVAEIRKLLRAGKVTKTLGVHVSPFGNFVTVGPLKTFNVGKEDYMTNLKNPEDYIQKVHHLMPGLRAEDLKPHYAGIMAVLKGSTDFIIKRDDVFPNCIQLVGMDSPAWTSCLAVAKYVKELIHK
ncbi:MAG: hypothetical protein A3D74_04160 [Candidatus Levybacteria bacterium RIFCSPHIGHO2_02_FULL_37_13]|nr:MAG: hypothetical protein A3D74_04160 [Candidatus Levybacteria bacterium RIFCSPHIGHO2_02_FULL_37_13]